MGDEGSLSCGRDAVAVEPLSMLNPGESPMVVSISNIPRVRRRLFAKTISMIRQHRAPSLGRAPAHRNGFAVALVPKPDFHSAGIAVRPGEVRDQLDGRDPAATRLGSPQPPEDRGVVPIAVGLDDRGVRFSGPSTPPSRRSSCSTVNSGRHGQTASRGRVLRSPPRSRQ